MKFNFKTKKSFLFLSGFFLGGGLIFLFSWASLSLLNNSFSFSSSVSAQELYQKFLCPCCGQTIDKECCQMAKERKAYVDSLVKEKKSKEEVILAYLQKYGLDSLKNPQKRKEYRKRLEKILPPDRPQVTITPPQIDLGKIDPKKGIVTASFEIENKGEKDLVIYRLETSCGCTTASLIFEGKESPRFGMPGHGINEKIKNWELVIPPQKKAQLKVYYDPNFHPNFQGPAIREIYLYSNDPISPKNKAQIYLYQIK